MADKKISALDLATTPLAGTEVLPIVQSSTTKRVTVANLTAGRAVATGAITSTVGDNGGNTVIQDGAGQTGFLTFQDSDGALAGRIKYDHSNNSMQFIVNEVEHVRIQSNGNVKINSSNIEFVTSGAGIDFSATPGTGTSELLADYEEGTFTPAITASSGTITSFTLGDCNYTKVGRMVAVNFSVTITDAGTGAGSLDVPLPFTNGPAIANGSGRENALTGSQLQARVAGAGTSMNIQTYANATAIATNAQIRASMTYFV